MKDEGPWGEGLGPEGLWRLQGLTAFGVWCLPGLRNLQAFEGAGRPWGPEALTPKAKTAWSDTRGEGTFFSGGSRHVSKKPYLKKV